MPAGQGAGLRRRPTPSTLFPMAPGTKPWRGLSRNPPTTESLRLAGIVCGGAQRRLRPRVSRTIRPHTRWSAPPRQLETEEEGDPPVPNSRTSSVLIKGSNQMDSVNRGWPQGQRGDMPARGRTSGRRSPARLGRKARFWRRPCCWAGLGFGSCRRAAWSCWRSDGNAHVYKCAYMSRLNGHTASKEGLTWLGAVRSLGLNGRAISQSDSHI